MQKNWFDLVVAKPEGEAPQIFMAPAWSHLKAGDTILVPRDDQFGADDRIAVVIFSALVDNKLEDSTVQVAKALTGDEYWPLRKVIGAYGQYDFSDYETKDTEETEEN